VLELPPLPLPEPPVLELPPLPASPAAVKASPVQPLANMASKSALNSANSTNFGFKKLTAVLLANRQGKLRRARGPRRV
jgi:hypothetical protein